MISQLKQAIYLAATILCSSSLAADLEEPSPVLVNGEILDVEHAGHAAPAVGDIDGDGDPDLLVGEFYQGRLRIYPNIGRKASPRFESFRVFQDGAATGRIHAS